MGKGFLKGWALAAAVFGLIISAHFSSLLRLPLNSYIWGVSVSADPIENIGLTKDDILAWRRHCTSHITNHSVPFGSVSPFEIYKYLVPGRVMFVALTLLTDKIFASLNITIIALFALNYFLTYWCARRLQLGPTVSLLPAVLITFNAYGYAHSWAHLGLTPIFYFPVFIFAFAELYRTLRMRYAVACALMAALALYTSPYYVYFLVWVGVCLLLGHTLAYRRWPLRFVVGLGLALFLAVLFVLPFFQGTYLTDYTPLWRKSWADAQYGDKIEWLRNYSAHPSDYILPFVHHVLYGEYFAKFIVDANIKRSEWSDEFPIFLGFGPLAFLLVLAAAACSALVAKVKALPPFLVRLRQPFTAAWQAHRGLYLSLLLLAAWAFLLSLVPTVRIFGAEVPMPNEFFRRFVPYRAYARFAMVVLTALVFLLALVVAQSRRPRLWTWLLIAVAVADSWPMAWLHRTSPDTPYIKYLRERPEHVMMRFEEQNIRHRRAVDTEAILAGKDTLNGEVNFNYGYSELPLTPNLPKFNLGQLAAMGAELLVVDGHIKLSPRDAPFAEVLRYFPEDDIEILKLTPDPDPRLHDLFAEYRAKHERDPCYVAGKAEVEKTLAQYIALISGQ